MPTTTVNALKRQPIAKSIAKWSGSDEPQSYYSREDDDTATLTVGEQRRIQCYYANAQRKWRNADEENDVRVVAAAKAIVREIVRETTTVAPVAATAASAAPPRVSSSFWTTPLSIASGEEPMFEPEFPENDECTHDPHMNLTKEQRAEKSKNFNFGLCCECDYGLQDELEFVCQSQRNGCATIYAKMCNACHNYHMDLFEKGVGGEHGGCN
jgi:hypothetical protein